MNLNLNLSDFRDGVDKIISPQQQKRASKVFEGLWGAVASPTAVAASSARREKKITERNEERNLMDDVDDDTIMPSHDSRFGVIAPDVHLGALDITASPSGYLTSSHSSSASASPLVAAGSSTPPIKEEKEEGSEDDWNW